MRVKIKAEYWTTGLFLAGCELLMLTGGMQDSFKIDGKMQDEKWKICELHLQPGRIKINIFQPEQD